MSVRFYMDVHVPAAITRGLRRRGVDVLTAQDDGAERLLDPELLDRALALGRVVFTQDGDFLAEAVRRQRAGLPFATVVCARQLRVSIGQCVEDMEIITGGKSFPGPCRFGQHVFRWTPTPRKRQLRLGALQTLSRQTTRLCFEVAHGVRLAGPDPSRENRGLYIRSL